MSSLSSDDEDDGSHTTELFSAINHNQIDTVQRLIQHKKVKANAKNGNSKLKNTALHDAIDKDRHEIAEFLIKLLKNSDINVVNKKNQTPLFVAVKKENFELTKILLENGAKINTPCIVEKCEENLEIKKQLLKSINVPSDGNCMFWAVSLAYLTAAKDDAEEFKKRFKKLFDQDYNEKVQNEIQNYNPFSKDAEFSEKLNELVTKTLRARIVTHMEANKENYENFLVNETEILLTPKMLENNLKKYLEKMKTPGEWGGEPELKALSEILECKIHVNSISTTTYNCGSYISLELYHENIDSTSHHRNHYNFSVATSIVDGYERSFDNKMKRKNDDDESVKTKKVIKSEPSTIDQLRDELTMPSGGMKLTQHGNIFQLKLLMLVLWRAAKSYKTFRLATELSEAEKFDDVVFQYVCGSIWKFRLLQAKHKEGKLEPIKESDLLSVIDKDPFSVQKYFRSFMKIKQRSRENSIYSTFSASQIEDSIIITNADFDAQITTELVRFNELETDELLQIDKRKASSLYKFKEKSILTEKLKIIFENTSDLYCLITKLANCVEGIEKIEKKGLFEEYYFAILRNVLELTDVPKKGPKLFKFKHEFIDSTDKELKVFRESLIKEIVFRETYRAHKNLKLPKNFGEPDKTPTKEMVKLGEKIRDNIMTGKVLDTENCEDHILLATEIFVVSNQKARFRTNLSAKFRKGLLSGGFLNEKVLKTEFDVSNDFGKKELPNDRDKLKQLAEKLIASLDEDKEIAKDYHEVIALEIIDVKGKNFKKDFINGTVKSNSVKYFRRILVNEIKIKKVLGEKSISATEKYDEEFSDLRKQLGRSITDIQKFSQQLVDLLKKSKEKNVKIIKSELTMIDRDLFIENIKCLGGLVLIERYGKVRFNTAFVKSENSLTLLTELRKHIKDLLGDDQFDTIHEYTFVIDSSINFKTCAEGEIDRRLPMLHDADDVGDFFNKFKFIVNYPNRDEINGLLESELQNTLRKLDAKAFNSLYQDNLLNWMAERIGTFYTAQKAETLFDEVTTNLSLWTMDGFTKSYFSETPCKYQFEFYEKLENFLKSNDTVTTMKFNDILIGRIRIVQTFKELMAGDYAELQKYTRGFGHIFLKADQLTDEIYSELNHNLVVIEFDKQEDESLKQYICSKVDAKIIFIVQSGSEEKESDFRYLINFYKDKMLKERQVVVQKRISQKTSLFELVSTTNHEIDTKTLVKYLKNEAVDVGNDLMMTAGYDRSNYIDRMFHRQVMIRKEIENDKRSGVFKDFLVYSKTDFDKYCEDFDNIHWLEDVRRPDVLVWRKSKGTISSLLKYRDIREDSYDPHIAMVYHEESLLNEQIVVISDTAGMGKTTVLTSLSLKMRETLHDWIIRIDLNKYVTILYEESQKRKDENPSFSAENKEKAIKFLFNLIQSYDKSELKSEIEKSLFQMMILNDRSMITLLFDGFDEISPDYTDIIVELLKAIKSFTKVKIFITTRPYMRDTLERSLDVFCVSLNQFSEVEQIEFIKKLWNINGNEEKLQTFSKQLILVLLKSISDKEKQFTGVPLQIKMVAEIFKAQCEQFVSGATNEIELPERLNLSELYEKFFKKKFYDLHWFGKKGMDFRQPNTKGKFEKSMEIKFMEEHKLLALARVFNEDELKKFCSEKEQQEMKDLIEQVKEAKEDTGIVCEVINGRPQFVHLTYAEYLVAAYFERNTKNDAQEILLTKILLQAEFKVVRAFFNSLEENMAVIGTDQMRFLELIGIKLKILWEQMQDELFILRVAVQEDNEGILKFIQNSLKGDDDTFDGLLNITDENDWNLVHEAMGLRMWNILKWLLTSRSKNGAGLDMNNPSPDGCPVLHAAVAFGPLELVKWLFSVGCDPRATYEFGKTAIFSAVEYGKMQTLQWLVYQNKMSIKTRDSFGGFISHEAAATGRVPILKWLKAMDFDVTAGNYHGETILHEAVRFEEKEVIVWATSENGGQMDVNATDNDGRSMLHVAATLYDIDMVNWLIEPTESGGMGMKIDIKDKKGRTVIHEAVSRQNIEMLKKLMHLIPENAVYSILEEAILCGILKMLKFVLNEELDDDEVQPYFTSLDHFSLVVGIINSTKLLHKAAWENKWSAVKYLIEWQNKYEPGCLQINERDGCDCTLLDITYENFNWDMMKFLIENGATVMVYEDFGSTILHLAVKTDNKDFLQFAIDKPNIDFSIRDKKGQSPLHLAVQLGKLEIVKMLNSSRAQNSISLRDNNDKTPLDLARELENREILGVLMTSIPVDA